MKNKVFGTVVASGLVAGAIKGFSGYQPMVDGVAELQAQQLNAIVSFATASVSQSWNATIDPIEGSTFVTGPPSSSWSGDP